MWLDHSEISNETEDFDLFFPGSVVEYQDEDDVGDPVVLLVIEEVGTKTNRANAVSLEDGRTYFLKGDAQVYPQSWKAVRT